MLAALLFAAVTTADCAAKTLACDATITAEPRPDCVDTYQFAGSAGQIAVITVSRVDGSPASASLRLVPPPGVAVSLPTVAGAGSPTLNVVLSDTGTWTIVVGTEHRYRLAMRCGVTALDPGQWQCAEQPFACGQTATWSIDSKSCQFSNGGAYVMYPLGDVPVGSVLDFRAHSDDFDPRVAVYHGLGGPVAVGNRGARSTTDSRIQYKTTDPGQYQIAVFAVDRQSFGNFTFYGDCAAWTCISPIISVPPRSATIPPGTSVELSVAATGTEPLTYAWHESAAGLGVIGTGRTLKVTPLARNSTFWVEVSNACGTATSAVATVTLSSARHRATKR